MPRYGYDYRYQGGWNRDAMRGYDRDHFRGNYAGGGPGGETGRYDRGYNTQRYTPAYGYDRGYGAQGYGGQGFAQGYDRPFHPMRGGYGPAYDQDMGRTYGGRMPAAGQGGGWRDAYQQMNERMRGGGWRSPWESAIPGQGLRPGFAFGTGHHGQYM